MAQNVNPKKHAILPQNEPGQDKMGYLGLNCLQAVWVGWGNSGYSDAEVISSKLIIQDFYKICLPNIE